MSQYISRDSSCLRECAHHQLLRNSDPKFTGDQLVPDKALTEVEIIPRKSERFALRGFVG
jgi:hypothetical protein